MTDTRGLGGTARYYAVIGNRDHIKVKDRRVPIWEFMERPPEGWLTSLVYACKELPGGEYARPMIFDCGAWSYKDSDDAAPKMGRNVVTPDYVFDRYREVARPGDFVIAPDHMLIPGLGNLDARRAFNAASAEAFLRVTEGSPYRPMAVVHGESAEERVETAKRYADRGYRALSLGGLAGQAARKKMALGVVARVREAVPGVWLHVLGLSSPTYASAWNRIGVDSFDGSSHFKQAFAGGAFFVQDGARLEKHQAGKGNAPEDIAPCGCLSCATLRSEGIDTRTYGSNENNMGRAVHNLNMLMRAHEFVRANPDALPVNLQGGLL